jgi:hypothetical protein
MVVTKNGSLNALQTSSQALNTAALDTGAQSALMALFARVTMSVISAISLPR